MVKTTVYLPEDTKRRLRTAARREGVSEAELIREAIDMRIRQQGRGFSLPKAPLSASTLQADDAEAILAEGFGE